MSVPDKAPDEEVRRNFVEEQKSLKYLAFARETPFVTLCRLRLPRSPAKRNLARNSSRTPGLQQSFTYRTMRWTSTVNGLSSFPRKITNRSAKRAWTFEANQLQTERQNCVGARLPSDSTSGDGYTVSSTNTDNKEKRKQDT
ncbi:hypothetical protein PoB_002457400 [Plakobranchus ocellatus]|uniref:Uncharacterized protein n=1 Tax=Plakobranchus ocellatus TaxID=259542 RepID=A0AAV3ZRV9_9GAST|nr:hypothetical protein PoB_002457400 [Plakobranchus ocellatus]